MSDTPLGTHIDEGFVNFFFEAMKPKPELEAEVRDLLQNSVDEVRHILRSNEESIASRYVIKEKKPAIRSDA